MPRRCLDQEQGPQDRLGSMDGVHESTATATAAGRLAPAAAATIRVSHTLLNYATSDTQRATAKTLHCCSPIGSAGRARAYHLKLTLATLLASCCLLLRLVSLGGQCAPTTTLASHHQHHNQEPPPPQQQQQQQHQQRQHQHQQHQNQHQHQQPKQLHHQRQSQSAEPAGKVMAAAAVKPSFHVNQAQHLHHSQQDTHEPRAEQISAGPPAGRPAPVAAEDEAILLVLADGEPSSPPFRRLMKRSGISDQRLAEIQMLRALKKQLERAATKIANESGGGGGGDGGSGGASSEVK